MTLNPRVDFAFKKLFGSEENKSLLKAFVNAVLPAEDQVASLELKNPYTLKRFQREKVSIFDIKAIDQRGRRFNIEMQITDQLDYEKRALHCWSNLYAEQINQGAGYNRLEKTIGIHILNFNLLDEPDYHNVYKVLNMNSKKPAFEDLQLHTIELKKFNQDMDHLTTALDRWVVFLQRAGEFKKGKVPKQLKAEPEIGHAIQVLNTLYLSDEEREIYENRQLWLLDEEEALRTAEIRGIMKGEARGYEKGSVVGLEQGRSEGYEDKLEIAKKLRAKGFSRDDIIEITGLSGNSIAT